jgi:hypothetical protein
MLFGGDPYSLALSIRARMRKQSRLAPTQPRSMIARLFPFAARYGEGHVRQVDGALNCLGAMGLLQEPKTYSANFRYRNPSWQALGRPGLQRLAG